jgi:hypothetical protein
MTKIIILIVMLLPSISNAVICEWNVVIDGIGIGYLTNDNVSIDIFYTKADNSRYTITSNSSVNINTDRGRSILALLIAAMENDYHVDIYSANAQCDDYIRVDVDTIIGQTNNYPRRPSNP